MNTIKETVAWVYARQPLRFLVVGAFNTGSGYLSFVLLYYFFSPYVHYTVIQAVCVVVNITCSYLCYKFIVFRTRGNYLREYLRFYAIYAVPLGLGFAFFAFAIEILRMNAYLAQALIVGFMIMTSYFGHKYFSFRVSTGGPPSC